MAAAKSKAQKLKIKRITRGRPRKEGAPRHPCGKIIQEWSKRESEQEAVSVAVEAAKRVHGIERKPNDALAGYTLGRIFLDGKIDEEQRKAGDEYAEIMARYYATVGVPFPSPRAQSLFSIKGHDGEITEELAKRARRASNRMMEMERILLSCIDGPQVKRTMFNVCIMDYEHLRAMPGQQMLWLRRGLTAIKNAREVREKAA